MRRENAPEDLGKWWDDLSEKMQWQVFDSAWIWSQVRKGKTVKDSMETVGYSQSNINKVLAAVNIDLRNAEHKKDTKPTFWMSKYNNDYRILEIRTNKFWNDCRYKNFPGLCAYIGCNKDTYLDSMSNECVPGEIIDILKREKLLLEAYQLEKIHESPAGGIFNLKNNHGYIDKREIKAETIFKEKTVDEKLMDHSNEILKNCTLELQDVDIEEV